MNHYASDELLLANLSEHARQIAQLLNTKIREGEVDVPMLPEVAGKVVQLSQDPDASALDLSKLIQSDQALAGHVMRIANSAAYSPNTTLISLQQAITRLGMHMISDIALSASVSTEMFHAPGYESYINDIWRHALSTALWSKEIARECRRNVEASFLCGLLHSIGRPVVLHSSIKMAKTLNVNLTKQDGLQLEVLYKQSMGTAVAHKWEMPKIVCEAITYFDDYKNAPHAREQTMMVNGGAQFATHMLTPENLSIDQLKELPVLADINLYHEEIESLLEQQDSLKSTLETMSS